MHLLMTAFFEASIAKKVWRNIANIYACGKPRKFCTKQLTSRVCNAIIYQVKSFEGERRLLGPFRERGICCKSRRFSRCVTAPEPETGNGLSFDARYRVMS